MSYEQEYKAWQEKYDLLSAKYSEAMSTQRAEMQRCMAAGIELDHVARNAIAVYDHTFKEYIAHMREAPVDPNERPLTPVEKAKLDQLQTELEALDYSGMGEEVFAERARSIMDDVEKMIDEENKK